MTDEGQRFGREFEKRYWWLKGKGPGGGGAPPPPPEEDEGERWRKRQPPPPAGGEDEGERWRGRRPPFVPPTYGKPFEEEKRTKVALKEWLEQYKLYALYYPGVPTPAYFDPLNKLLHSKPVGYPVFYDPVLRKATLKDTGIRFVMTQYKNVDLSELWNEYWQEKADDVDMAGFSRPPMYFDVEKRELTDVPTSYPVYWDEKTKRMTFKPTGERFKFDIGVTVPETFYSDFAELYARDLQVNAGQNQQLYLDPRGGQIKLTTAKTPYPIYIDPITGSITLERTGHPYVTSGTVTLPREKVQRLLADYLNVYGVKPNGLTAEGSPIYFNPITLTFDVTPGGFMLYRDARGHPTFANTGVPYKLTTRAQFDIQNHMDDLMESLVQVYGDHPLLTTTIKRMSEGEDEGKRLFLARVLPGAEAPTPMPASGDMFTPEPVYINGPSGAPAIPIQGSTLERVFNFFENFRIGGIPLFGGALANNFYTSAPYQIVSTVIDLGVTFVQMITTPATTPEQKAWMDNTISALNRAKTQDEINTILEDAHEYVRTNYPDYNLGAPYDVLPIRGTAQAINIVAVDTTTWRIVPPEDVAERRMHVPIRWMPKTEYYKERLRRFSTHFNVAVRLAAEMYIPGETPEEDLLLKARNFPLGDAMLKHGEFLDEVWDVIKSTPRTGSDRDKNAALLDAYAKRFGLTYQDFGYESVPEYPALDLRLPHFVAGVLLRKWREERWATEIEPLYRDGISLYNAGDTDRAMEMISQAVYLDILTGRSAEYSGSVSVTLAGDPHRMREYMENVALATLQKGEPLTSNELWLIRREYEDPIMEGVYQGATESILVLPDLIQGGLFEALGKAMRGTYKFGGFLVRLGKKTPGLKKVVTPASDIFEMAMTESLRTMRYTTRDLAETTLRTVLEYAEPETLPDTMATIVRNIQEGKSLDEFIQTTYHVSPSRSHIESLERLVKSIQYHNTRVEQMIMDGILTKNPFKRWMPDEIATTIAEIAEDIATKAGEHAEDVARMLEVPEEMMGKVYRSAYTAAAKNTEMLTKAIARELSLDIAHTSLIPGWGLMADSLLYRSIRRLGLEGSESLQAVNRAWQVMYGAFRNMWIFQVLPGRVAWLARNIYDSMLRYILAGGALFSDLGSITNLTYSKIIGSGKYPTSVIEAFVRALPGERKVWIERILAGEFAGQTTRSLIGRVLKENYATQINLIKEDLSHLRGPQAVWRTITALSRGLLTAVPVLPIGNTISDLSSLFEGGIRLRLLHKLATENFTRLEREGIEKIIQIGKEKGLTDELIEDMIAIYRGLWDNPKPLAQLVRDIKAGKLEHFILARNLDLKYLENIVAHLEPFERDILIRPALDFFVEQLAQAPKITPEGIRRLVADARKVVDEMLDAATRSPLQALRSVPLTTPSIANDIDGEELVKQIMDVGAEDILPKTPEEVIEEAAKLPPTERAIYDLRRGKYKSASLYIRDWVAEGNRLGIAIDLDDEMSDLYQVMAATDRVALVLNPRKLGKMPVQKAKQTLLNAVIEWAWYVDPEAAKMFDDPKNYVKTFTGFLKNPASVSPQHVALIEAQVGKLPGFADLLRYAYGKNLPFTPQPVIKTISEALGIPDQEVADMIRAGHMPSQQVIDAADSFVQKRALLGKAVQRALDSGDQATASYLHRYQQFLSRVLGDVYGGRLGRFMREVVPGPMRATGVARAKRWDDFFALGARFSEALADETGKVLGAAAQGNLPEKITITYQQLLKKMSVHIEFDETGRLTKVVFPRTVSGAIYVITDRPRLDMFFHMLIGAGDPADAKRMLTTAWDDLYAAERVMDNIKVKIDLTRPWPSSDLLESLKKDPAFADIPEEKIRAVLAGMDLLYDTIKRATGMTDDELREAFPTLPFWLVAPVDEPQEMFPRGLVLPSFRAIDKMLSPNYAEDYVVAIGKELDRMVENYTLYWIDQNEVYKAMLLADPKNFDYTKQLSKADLKELTKNQKIVKKIQDNPKRAWSLASKLTKYEDEIPYILSNIFGLGNALGRYPSALKKYINDTLTPDEVDEILRAAMAEYPARTEEPLWKAAWNMFIDNADYYKYRFSLNDEAKLTRYHIRSRLFLLELLENLGRATPKALEPPPFKVAATWSPYHMVATRNVFMNAATKKSILPILLHEYMHGFSDVVIRLYKKNNNPALHVLLDFLKQVGEITDKLEAREIFPESVVEWIRRPETIPLGKLEYLKHIVLEPFTSVYSEHIIPLIDSDPKLLSLITSIFAYTKDNPDDLIRARLTVRTALKGNPVFLHPEDMGRMLGNLEKHMGDYTDEDWIPITPEVKKMIDELREDAYRDAVLKPALLSQPLPPDVEYVARWQLEFMYNTDILPKELPGGLPHTEKYNLEPLIKTWATGGNLLPWAMSIISESGLKASDDLVFPPNPRWLQMLGYSNAKIQEAENAWKDFLKYLPAKYPSAFGGRQLETFDDFAQFLAESNYQGVTDELWKAYIQQPIIGTKSLLGYFGESAKKRDTLLDALDKEIASLQERADIGLVDQRHVDALEIIRDTIANWGHAVRSLRIPSFDKIDKAIPIPYPVWRMPPAWQTWLGGNLSIAQQRLVLTRIFDVIGDNLIEALKNGQLGKLNIPAEFADSAADTLSQAFTIKSGNLADALEVAANKVGEYLLNYSRSTVLDEAMRSVFPFWMFPSRSVVFWAKMLGHHPEVFRWYARYMSASERNLRQRGLVTTSGEAIPSLVGKMRIPGTQIWVDPTKVFSFNFYIPRPWLINTMTDRYDEDDETTVKEIIYKTMLMGEFFGFSSYPWMRSQIENFAGQETGFEDFTLLPMMELVPPWIQRHIRSQLRRTVLRSLADMPFWTPDYDFMDFITETRLLGRALEEIEATTVMSEKLRIANETREALGYRPRYDQDGNYIGYTTDINRTHPRWTRAYNEVSSGQYYASLIGYFTGFYGREYTDAEIELYRLRHETNLLRDAINKEILREGFFPIDLGPEEFYQAYVSKRYDTAEGEIYNLSGTLSFVRAPSGELITDPMERRTRIIELIDRDERERAYYDSVEALNLDLQKTLAEIPLGDDEARSAAYALYFKQRAELDENPMYAEARRSWTFGYKPKTMIVDHFVDLAFQMYREAKPVRRDGEDYNTYQARLRIWERDFERIKPDLLTAVREAAVSASSGYQINANGEIVLPGNRALSLDDLMSQVEAKVNRNNYEAWIKARMTVLDAIQAVYDKYYVAAYWEKVTAAEDKFQREIARREFLAKGKPSAEQIAQWVLEEFGDQFTTEEVINALKGRDIMSMQDILEPQTNEAAIEEEIWKLLLMAGPSTTDLRNRIEELGGRSSDIDVWYATNGNVKAWGDILGLRAFHDVLKRAVEDLNLTEPDTKTLTEWSTVRNLNDKFYAIARESLGQDIEQVMTKFYNLEGDDQDKFLEEHPEVNLYRLLRDKFAVEHPIWAKYFNTRAYQEIQAGETPYWIRKLEKGTVSGGTGTGTGTSAGTGRRSGYRVISSAMRLIPMGYRSTLDPAYLSPFTVGRAGAGGTIVIPAKVVRIVGKRGVEQIQNLAKGGVLSDVLANLLKRARYRFPDIAPFIDEILKMHDENLQK